jgi:hypothetical protein
MGGGNAQKSAMRRERKMEKGKKEPSSQLKVNEAVRFGVFFFCNLV